MEEYQRFDCHPEEDADEAQCTARGCNWKVRGDTDEVHMHMHTSFLYSITKQTEKTENMFLKSFPFCPHSAKQY